MKPNWSMKRCGVVTLISAILFSYTPSIQSASLLQLDAKLRHRVNEIDTAIALFDTTNSFSWFNQGQDKIAVIAGYFPKFIDSTLSNVDSSWFKLPADFRQIKAVYVIAQKRFYPVFPNPGFLGQAQGMQYSIVWQTEDTARLLIVRGGFQDKQTNVIFSADSSTYRLPSDVRNVVGCMVWAGQWEPITLSPMFTTDGTRLYDIHFKHRDTALLYLRGGFADGDTVRVFYQKTVETSDKIRIEYLSSPVDMAGGSTECEVPNDLEEYLVEEVLGYYFDYKGDRATAQAFWQRVRIDLGVLKPQGQQ